jgi:hypothetical protein
MIRLDNVETEREVLAAVNVYLACLRKGIRTQTILFHVARICPLPVERIREDARSDLRLIFYCPGIMEKVIADEKIDDDLKNYARYLLTRDPQEKDAVMKALGKMKRKSIFCIKLFYSFLPFHHHGGNRYADFGRRHRLKCDQSSRYCPMAHDEDKDAKSNAILEQPLLESSHVNGSLCA